MSIRLTQGDSATIRVTLNKDQGLFDLTGAALETRLLNADGTDLVLGNSAHTVLDQTASKGQFTFALTSVQTQALRGGSSLPIQTKVVQGPSTTYFKGRVLTVDERELG